MKMKERELDREAVMIKTEAELQQREMGKIRVLERIKIQIEEKNRECKREKKSVIYLFIDLFI